jgi:hypothetical protein
MHALAVHWSVGGLQVPPPAPSPLPPPSAVFPYRIVLKLLLGLHVLERDEDTRRQPCVAPAAPLAALPASTTSPLTVRRAQSLESECRACRDKFVNELQRHVLGERPPPSLPY